MNGPRWIKQWIADLALLNEQFRNDDGNVDFEALGREEYMFRTALITQKLDKSDRARDIYMKAKAAYDASSENGKKGGRPKKNLSADGDTREDSQDVPDCDNAATLESSTSAETGTLDSLTDKDERPGAERATSKPSRTLPLPTWEDFLSFVDGEGLDYTDAREWWEMTMVDRKGHDRNGKPIGNWKGALKRFCKSKINNREA